MHVAVTVLTGIALGCFSHESSSLPGAWRWVGNFGALWLAVAFLVGRWTRSTRIGALAGATSLVIASVVHYVPYRIAREGLSWDAFRWPVVLWVAVGVIVGAASGVLGATHAQRGRLAPVGAASLVAAFAGEAFVLFRTGHPRAAQVAVPVELAVAAFLPFVLTRSWRLRAIVVGTSVLLLPLVVLALSAFMGVIHRVYPGI